MQSSALAIVNGIILAAALMKAVLHLGFCG